MFKNVSKRGCASIMGKMMRVVESLSSNMFVEFEWQTGAAIWILIRTPLAVTLWRKESPHVLPVLMGIKDESGHLNYFPYHNGEYVRTHKIKSDAYWRWLSNILDNCYSYDYLAIRGSTMYRGSYRNDDHFTDCFANAPLSDPLDYSD